jgi:hypothetical protein
LVAWLRTILCTGPKKANLPDPEYYRADLNRDVPPTNYYPNRAEYGITADETVGEERKQLSVTAVRQGDDRFRCNMCDKDYGRNDHLTQHKQSKHEGVRYVCDQCDYKATKQGHLNTHKQYKHEGVRYGCDQCDYKATTQSSLTTHQKFMH